MAREDLAEASADHIFIVFGVCFDAIPHGWQGFGEAFVDEVCAYLLFVL